MKFNKWTVGLAAVGVVSLASAARADEQTSMVNTALSQTTLSGYVDVAAQWNPGTDSHPYRTSDYFAQNLPPYSFAKNDGFSLNAVDIALDKPEDSSAWAAGYHVEVMFGADAVGVPVGYSYYSESALTIRQAFIRLHTPVGGNGIDWEIGVFDNLIGYESNSDPLNPNYTRSYGYTIEPTTMTGIMGTYKVNDMLSLSAGIADNDGGLGGITPVANPSYDGAYESQKTYFGTVTFTAPDSMGFMKGATATAGVVHGASSQVAGDGNNTSLYIGATIPTPMNQLKVGAAFDYLFENNIIPHDGFTAKSDGDIWVAGLYATFQATDKLSFDARAEYVSDDSVWDQNAGEGDNVHLFSYEGTGPFGEGTVFHSNKAEEITLTAQYNLWANVMTRAEFRWDHVEHGNQFGASPNPGQFGDNQGNPYKNNDFLLALNLIYQF